VTDFADFKTQIAEWANREDWSDSLITSFIRMAEQKFNAELLVDRMMKVAIDTVDHSCANLPDDWIKADFMLIQTLSAPQGWTPIEYQPSEKFFRLPDTLHSSTNVKFISTFGYYTIRARTIYFGGPIDALNGTSFRMHYYSEVPIFSDTVPSWIYTKYPSLYLFAAMMHADLHAVGEEDKAGGLKMLVEDQIQKLNAQHLLAKASGSRLHRGHTRSFG
jgi:hypothetical protein